MVIEMRMGIVKGTVFHSIRMLNQYVIVHILKWSTGELLNTPKENKNPVETGPYVESVDYINVTLLMAAVSDHKQQLEQDSANCQAVLNACLEAVRHDQFIIPAMQMFGSLATGKYQNDPCEAMARVLANVLMTGMLMEKRLQKES